MSARLREVLLAASSATNAPGGGGQAGLATIAFSATTEQGTQPSMLDQIRREILNRLDELLGEADKLRRALYALGSSDGAASVAPEPPAGVERPDGAGERPAPALYAVASAAASAASPDVQSAGVVERTAPGATRRAVLAALAGGDAMTAGEVAAATGLGRASVSTTLSKLRRPGN